jgi:hypothetical protein
VVLTFHRVLKITPILPDTRELPHRSKTLALCPSLTQILTISLAFVCPEPGCGRQFSVMSNMRRHQKTHRPKSAGGDSDSSGGDEGKEANTPPSVHEEYAGHSSFARKHHLNNRGHRTSNSMSPQAIRRDLARHSPRHGGYPNDDDDLEQHHSRRPFTSPN